MSELRFEIAIPMAPPRTDKNSRAHWRERYGVDGDAKTVAYYCTRKADIASYPSGRIDAEIAWTVYLPKGAKRSDLDNMIGRLKAFQDGIFMALGLDDRIVRGLSVEQRRDPEGLGRTVAVVTIRPKGQTA